MFVKRDIENMWNGMEIIFSHYHLIGQNNRLTVDDNLRITM